MFKCERHKASAFGGFCPDCVMESVRLRADTIEKPVEPEWDGEGIPPVGCECEYKALDDWLTVKIVAVGQKHILMYFAGMELCRCIRDSSFRPIRTKEQRERDEIRSLIASAEHDGVDYYMKVNLDKAVDALLKAGYRKPENS